VRRIQPQIFSDTTQHSIGAGSGPTSIEVTKRLPPQGVADMLDEFA